MAKESNACASRSSGARGGEGARATSSRRAGRRRRPRSSAIKEITKRIDELKTEAERAERGGNLQRVAEIRYGELPALEKELVRARQLDDPMVKEEVDEDDIAAVVARWTGIPVDRLLEGETEKLVHMEERLHQRVVGQDEAVEAVANALRRARTGLQDPNRPIGSFVFLGPTGVGKTELARALAEFMFDDERAMVRLDMSEYQERHTVARLDRRAARLRRLRGGRPAHRGGAAAPVLRRPARRDREGARRGVRRAAAGARRRAADRRPGPHGRLPQHGADHDVEHPQRRGDARALPAGVPQPDRRDRRVRAAVARADRARSSSTSSSASASGSPSAASRSSSPTRRRRRSSRPAGTRRTARARSSARSSACSRTRSRCGCSRATSATATRSASTPATASSRSRKPSNACPSRSDILAAAPRLAIIPSCGVRRSRLQFRLSCRRS